MIPRVWRGSIAPPQVEPPSFRGKCYVRYDGVYDHEMQTHHVSGVCNHTLVPGGGGGGATGLGVHGLSVGSRLIDFVPETTSSKVCSVVRRAFIAKPWSTPVQPLAIM